MGLVKHGTGEILPEPEDSQKTAAANWTADDAKALEQENSDADKE